MTDEAERVRLTLSETDLGRLWLVVGCLVLILAITVFAFIRAVQVGAPWSPVQNQPAEAAARVAQNAGAAPRLEPEYVSVTPDLEADQLFREFQAYRHWGLGRK